jgi:hypothetical protein
MPREQTSLGHSSDLAGSELLETLREMSRNWMERGAAEVERGSKLSRNLSAAHSVPDAISAYQEWLTEEMGARAEDARLLMSNGQKFVDTSSRLLANAWASGSTTT